MCVYLVEEPQRARGMCREFSKSLWPCLCSDSTASLNAVHKLEQRSGLELVQDHVQPLYSREPLGNHFLAAFRHRGNSSMDRTALE